MINLIVKFTTTPEGKEAFLEALLENRKGSQQEAGFVSMKLFEDTQDSNVIIAYDVWKDEAAVESHKDTVHALSMMKVAESTLACPPEIKFVKEI